MDRQRAPRILVVDDEASLRTTLADILEDEGYRVDTAESAEVALVKCKAVHFEVLIMDMRMPGMSGAEALTKIVATNVDTRVILMSAYAVEDVKRAALHAGAVAFVNKPLDLEHLLDLVEQSHRAAVLVVSDDPGAASLADALKAHGYRVTLAKSSRAAVELAQQISFSVLLIDAELAAGNALDLYRTLQRISPGSDAVMLTGNGHATRDDVRATLAHTGCTHLAKHRAREDLPRMMLNIVRQRAAGAPFRAVDTTEIGETEHGAEKHSP